MLIPYPDNLNLNKQSVPVPGTETSSTSASWVNGSWDSSVLRYDDQGLPHPRTLAEIFDQAVEKSPDTAMFRRRVQAPATKPGEKPTWTNKTVDMSYAEVQRRRNAVGSALLTLERLGRLRDPNLPADVESPPEICTPNLPKWGNKLKNGARRGWAVGIWSENREEWQIVDFACHAYGLVSASLYETLGPDTAQYITNHCPLPIIFSSAHHLVQLLRMAPLCPSLRVIVTMDPISAAERDVLSQWAASLGILLLDQLEMEEWGAQADNFVPPTVADDEIEIDQNRIVTISYTSGTTGNPKGVILSNWNMTSAVISNAYGVGEYFDNPGFKFFSYLPLSHVYERFLQILVVGGNGTICLTTGDTTKLLEDAQILKPNFFPGVPRVWNRVYAAIKMQMDAPGLKGALLRRAVATKLANSRTNGSIHHRVYDALVFRKIRALVGGEVLYMSSGAAPLSAAVHEFLRICFCCDVVQGYGLTETVGTTSKGIPEDMKHIGTVGQIQPCNEVRLVDVSEMGYTHQDKPNPRGEVCIRGDNVFAGYLHDAENTEKALKDGWFHTGDIGEIDQSGRLKIVDRVKNVVKLSQGEYVALEKVEGVYALNPLYTTLLVHADSLRSSLVAVGILEPTLASNLVAQVLGKKISPTDEAALEEAVKDPKVRAHLVKQFQQVAKANKLNSFEMIRGIYPTLKPFPDDLLTPTQKVKRNVAAKYFGDAIDALYNEVEGAAHKL
ncbi:hypothetical protein CspHIS471_0304030 [Cutaneotrichosporon sp. HIS471]|nr:hypothetical protein CspHIS471_0304030 [Cutaneotrichosporon sp. HIS471]